MDRIVPGIFCKRPCGMTGEWTQGCHVIPLLYVGYLLLGWLCFITVRSETIASIKNNKNFMLTGLGVAVMGIWGRLKGGRGCTVQGGE